MGSYGSAASPSSTVPLPLPTGPLRRPNAAGRAGGRPGVQGAGPSGDRGAERSHTLTNDEVMEIEEHA